MDRYKIQIFSHITLTHAEDGPHFLWITHKTLKEPLEELVKTNGFYFTSNPYDKEEDLDLIKANIWKHKLIKFGVECEIVKIDYSEERNDNATKTIPSTSN